MKFKAIPFALLICSAFLLTYCKKEKTYDQKLTGNWISTQVISNGTDYTNQYTFTLNLHSSQAFERTLGIYYAITDTTLTSTDSGIWDAEETTQELTLSYTGSTLVENYSVVDLTDNSMKLEGTLNGIESSITLARY